MVDLTGEEEERKEAEREGDMEALKRQANGVEGVVARLQEASAAVCS